MDMKIAGSGLHADRKATSDRDADPSSFSEDANGAFSGFTVTVMGCGDTSEALVSSDRGATGDALRAAL